ncbi:hypothetical protein AB0D24_27705 [Streptomyces javensis]|uniref:hypothetical protein n=1 Tax=Streptomyces javensis TaxID=114698 RepID=UPI0033EDC169
MSSPHSPSPAPTPRSCASVAAARTARQLTARRFVPDRITGGGGPLYRGGDRGRLLDNGELEHLGGLDDQVKIRGHRIELGQIRGVLLEHAHVQDATAVARATADAANACVDAHVVPARRPDRVSALRGLLAAAGSSPRDGTAPGRRRTATPGTPDRERRGGTLGEGPPNDALFAPPTG